MATFDIITAESFAEESLQGESRKRQRYREAVSCSECRQKKIKVYEGLLFHAHILHSDQNRSVIEVFRAISAKAARSGPGVPSPKQHLYVHLKVEHLPATLRNDDRLRFSPVPRPHGMISKKTSVVMRFSCPAPVLEVQSISRYRLTRAGRPRLV